MTHRNSNPWTQTLVKVAAVMVALITTGCDHPDNGTYSRQDVGLSAEEILFENNTAWIKSSQKKTEHRIIRDGTKIRIETLEGKLQGNYRIYDSGLLCIENEKFYRKEAP